MSKKGRSTTRKVTDWRKVPLNPDYQCKHCKRMGSLAEIGPYYFPDLPAGKFIWLCTEPCSLEYYEKWREWCRKQTSRDTS